MKILQVLQQLLLAIRPRWWRIRLKRRCFQDWGFLKISKINQSSNGQTRGHIFSHV
jgi:hypothetical protein